MKTFNVAVKGICPLLQARHPDPDEEAKIAQRKGSKSTKIKTKALTDDEQFDMHAYRTSKKKFYQPSEMFEAAMTRAAVNFKMEGKKSYKDVIKGGLIVEPIEIVHANQKFEMDARWGKNPSTGGAVWVVRPRVDDWEMNFSIKLLQDERVSADVLKDILIYAGLYVGIGSWRPKFGQFEVTKFQEVKEKKSKN